MSAFKGSYSYESLLENLRETHNTRKKRYEDKEHLLTDDAKAFEKFLFTLENDVLTKKDQTDRDVVIFDFDDLMNETNFHEVLDASDSVRELENSNATSSERKHICSHAGCNKSYTSSHGLKYHLLHGHSKEKENVYKPFICTVPKCGKAYRNSNGLKYHMANAHAKDR